MTENLSESGQTSDTRLIARAVKQRWPISDALRSSIVARMGKIILGTDMTRGKTPSRREVMAASRCLLDADRLNLAQEERDNPTPVKHEHTGVVTLATLLAQVDATGQLPPKGQSGNVFDVEAEIAKLDMEKPPESV